MNKKILTLTSLVLFISLGFSLFQGYNRHLADQAYKNVQVLVHYDDLVSFSRLTGQSLESVSEQFKAVGATGVLVKERTIRATLVNAQNSLEQSLEAITYSGIELQSRDNGIQGVDYRRFYGWIPDEGLRNSVMKHLKWKRGYGDSVAIYGREFVDYGPGDLSVLSIGVGYPIENLEKIASVGLTVSPQIKDWEASDSDVLELVLEEATGLPGLGDIYFNDVTLPNVKHDAMRQLAQNHTIGYIEFFSNRQKGIGELIKTPSEGDALSVVRLHSLTGQQIATRPLRQNLDQLNLAVNERNIRAILIGFPLVGHPEEMFESALSFVSQFKSEIEAEGFAVSSETHWFELPIQSGVQVLLIGLGPIAALIFLGHLMKQPKLSYGLVALGTVGYTGLLYLSPYLAKQAMALYASIVFPTIGMVYVLKSPAKSIGMAIRKYLAASMISLMGSLTVVGILSEPTYAMGLDQFRGVKLVSVVPLILFAALMFYKEGGFEWQKIKCFLYKHVNYITLIALAVVAVVLFRYVQRTGNTATVSSLELSFRQLLNNIMGVRPRTKEFLIGHPIFLMTLWMGYQKKWLPLILVALIGQVSMVNTFAHLHTPVMVSVVRTFHGLWLGLVIGACGCFVLSQFEKIMKSRKSNG